MVHLLTVVSRKKQKDRKLTWREWLDIPENVYLLQLDENIAKKVFNESNYLIQEAVNKSQMFEASNSEGLKGQSTNPIYGLDFDGEKQHLDTTFSENGETPTDRTYSWWMKSDETGVNKGVFGYGAHTKEAFHLNWSSGRPLLFLGSNWYRYWDDTSAQDDNQWHHWMVFSDISDPSSCKLYVDGEEQTANTTKTNGRLFRRDVQSHHGLSSTRNQATIHAHQGRC